MTELKDQLSLLGRKTEYKQDYAPEVLEAFDNKHPGNDYWVRFNCPEFTSLCPITGQPDFAEIRISYIPDVKMVESKSLKLYLFSFRNHGAFHEDCVNIIMKDLIRLMNPKYIEVTGIFTPRRHLHLSLCKLWTSRHEVRTNGGTSVDEPRIEWWNIPINSDCGCDTFLAWRQYNYLKEVIVRLLFLMTFAYGISNNLTITSN